MKLLSHCAVHAAIAVLSMGTADAQVSELDSTTSTVTEPPAGAPVPVPGSATSTITESAPVPVLESTTSTITEPPAGAPVAVPDSTTSTVTEPAPVPVLDSTTSTITEPPATPSDPLLAAKTSQNCANDASLPGQVLEFPLHYYTVISPEQCPWQPDGDDWTRKTMFVGSTYRALLNFDTKIFPKGTDLEVVCASVDFEQTNSPTVLELHRMRMPWDTKATWVDANGVGKKWDQAGGDYDNFPLSTFRDGVQAPSSIFMVDVFQKIVDGLVQNHGLLIRAKDTDDNAIELSNPRLYIRYISNTWTPPPDLAYVPGSRTKPPSPPIAPSPPVPKPTCPPTALPEYNKNPVDFDSTDDDEPLISKTDNVVVAVAAVGGIVGTLLVTILVYCATIRCFTRKETIPKHQLNGNVEVSPDAIPKQDLDGEVIDLDENVQVAPDAVDAFLDKTIV